MKLYEYELKQKCLTKREYEVKETEKNYNVLPENGRNRFIQYNCYTRVPKDILNKVHKYSLGAFYFITLENNIEKVKKALREYLISTAIPVQEDIIKRDMAYCEGLKSIAESLETGNGLEVTNNEL